MTDLEGRIKRRILIENATEEMYEHGVGREAAPLVLVSATSAARIAALEVEDSANPIAQTQQVRPPLRLNIDIAAFQAVYDDLDHE